MLVTIKKKERMSIKTRLFYSSENECTTTHKRINLIFDGQEKSKSWKSNLRVWLHLYKSFKQVDILIDGKILKKSNRRIIIEVRSVATFGGEGRGATRKGHTVASKVVTMFYFLTWMEATWMFSLFFKLHILFHTHCCVRDIFKIKWFLKA